MDEALAQIWYDRLKDGPVGRRSPMDVWFFDEQGVLCEQINQLFAPSTVRHVAFIKPGYPPVEPIPHPVVEQTESPDEEDVPQLPKNLLCLCGKTYSRRISIEACEARDHKEVNRGRSSQSPVSLWGRYPV